ncbi:hypothetical protein AMJ85_11530 [candidate division BRC1 bacterium SM23_51]|nr:MAG: hypothetical protein AMJ85_11530 [candidate division BRC1 bacterium SM23_51]
MKGPEDGGQGFAHLYLLKTMVWIPFAVEAAFLWIFPACQVVFSRLSLFRKAIDSDCTWIPVMRADGPRDIF